MTGQGEDVDRGDYILLQYGSDCVRYQVKEIDYYAKPPDMWIALLKKQTIDLGIAKGSVNFRLKLAPMTKG